MRIIIIFILSVSFLSAQDYSDSIFISADSLKSGSISFNQAWRFSSGDDTLWSMPEFDDTEWDTLNPGLTWGDYDTNVWKGIGWFRKNIIIDSALQNSSVAISIRHSGASEIYLNGKLVKSFGSVSEIPDSEKVYQPNGIPFSLNFGVDTNYLLAVRYSNHQSVHDPEWVDHWFGPHGFHLRINEIDSLILDLVLEGKMSFGVNFLIGGIFLSLSILYFLLFVYSIFYENIPKQIWVFISGILIMGIMLFISPIRDYLNYVIPIFIFLATIEGFRVIIIAIKNKKENSWVIGAGVIVFVSLILTIFILTLFNLQIKPKFVSN